MTRIRFVSLLLTLIAGCARKAPAPPGITVSAAISLKESFTEIAAAFERAHPGVPVALNFGASGELARQVEAGAPADVIATADERTLERLVEAGLVDVPSRRPLAKNQLVLITRANGLSGVRFASLGFDARIERLAAGSPETVPAGAYAKTYLTSVGALPPLATKMVWAANVRQVLDYVARGEADAGVVYATDVATTSNVVIADRAPLNDPRVQIRYPIAALSHAAHPADARAFVELAAGPIGQAALAKHGFLHP